MTLRASLRTIIVWAGGRTSDNALTVLAGDSRWHNNTFERRCWLFGCPDGSWLFYTADSSTCWTRRFLALCQSPQQPKLTAGTMASTSNRTDKSDEQGLGIPAFCKRYGVGRTTAFKILKDGVLARYKVGRRTLIHAEDAERWFQSCAQGPK